MFKRLWKWRLTVLVSLLSSLAVVISQLAIPLLIGMIVDVMMVSADQLFGWLLALVVFALVAGLSYRLVLLNGQKLVAKTVQELRNDVFQHLSNIPLLKLNQWQPGELVSRLNSDIEQIGQALYLVFAQFFVAVLTIVLTFVIMAWLNVWMALMVLCLTPLSFLSSRFVSRQFSKWFQAMTTAKASDSALVHELVLGYQQIKLFQGEQMVTKQFICESQKLSKASEKAVFYSSIVNPLTRFINLLIYLTILFVGFWFVYEKQLTVGIFVVFLSYAKTYSSPFNEIAGVYIELKSAIVSYQKVQDILSVPLETQHGTIAPCHLTDRISMMEIDFSYQLNKKVIERVSLEIKEGQTVALVGPTGSGKSTLINLLLRYYLVDKGCITIDCHLLNDYSSDALADLYGVVFQEIWLKKGTVRENLCLNRDISNDAMVAMAKKTTLHQFVMQLPQAYDTQLDQLDERLSLGQQQLICLTRALLSQSEVLIFDESTASLDTRTELLLMQAMAEVMKQRTSIVVAHRLSTIVAADVIFVLQKGRIVQQGTHQQLMREEGLYKRLVASQMV